MTSPITAKETKMTAPIKFTVYMKIYPQLGGLGWIWQSAWSTRRAAKAELNRLVEWGHDRKRVGINV